MPLDTNMDTSVAELNPDAKPSNSPNIVELTQTGKDYGMQSMPNMQTMQLPQPMPNA